MVPAKGIPVPDESVSNPSRGTLRPDPMGSGYSIPRRAGTGVSQSGRGISPGLMLGSRKQNDTHSDVSEEDAEALLSKANVSKVTLLQQNG